MSFYNQQGLKTRVLEIHSMAGIESGRHTALLLGRRHENNLGTDSHLKKPWDTQGEIIPSSQNKFLGTRTEIPLQRQWSCLVSLPSPSPQHKKRTNCYKHQRTYSGCLTCLYQVQHPCTLPPLPFLVKLVLDPWSLAGPCPRRPAETPCSNNIS